MQTVASLYHQSQILQNIKILYQGTSKIQKKTRCPSLLKIAIKNQRAAHPKNPVTTGIIKKAVVSKGELRIIFS